MVNGFLNGFLSGKWFFMWFFKSIVTVIRLLISKIRLRRTVKLLEADSGIDNG